MLQLKAELEAEPVQVPEPEGSAYGVVGVNDGALLDVRASAGTGQRTFQLAHDAVGLRGTGKTAEFDGVKWLEITTADRSRGWVSAASVAPTAKAPSTYAVVGVESDDALNLRAGPGVGNPVVGTLPYDTGGLMPTGRADDVGKDRWVEVATIGWVNARYLEEAGGAFESVGDGDTPEMDPLTHGDIGDEI